MTIARERQIDKRTALPYILFMRRLILQRGIMTTISVNQFRDHLRHYVDEAEKNHGA